MQDTLQLAVRLQAAMCDTDDGSCHFHFQVPTALSGTGVCLCLILLLNVVYLCQTRVGRRHDKTNVKW